MREPMEPCPYHPKGRHEMNAIVPDNDEHDFILFCAHCGAIRREPVTPLAPVDDLDAVTIERLVRG